MKSVGIRVEMGLTVGKGKSYCEMRAVSWKERRIAWRTGLRCGNKHATCVVDVTLRNDSICSVRYIAQEILEKSYLSTSRHQQEQPSLHRPRRRHIRSIHPHTRPSQQTHIMHQPNHALQPKLLVPSIPQFLR